MRTPATLTIESSEPTNMSFSVIKTPVGCASNTPSSSRPATINMPTSERNASHLSPGRSSPWGWQAHGRDGTSASHQTHLNMKSNVQLSETESLPTPGSLISSPLTRKAQSSSLGKVTGKRSASTAEIGEASVPQKRARREDPTEAPRTSEPSVPKPQPDHKPYTLTITEKTIRPTSYAEEGTVVSSHCSIDWEYWLVPEFAGTPNSSKDISMIESIDMLYAGLMRSEESLHTSSDLKLTHLGDLLQEEDRENAVQAAASYEWRDLYSPPPREETTPSSPTSAFALSVSTQGISEDASQPRRSSTSALSSGIPVAGEIPSNPFRYTSETEAEIRDAVLEANYPEAYRLFDPSECPLVIAGDEVRRFVSENPSKVTATGRKASRLWVCQATATWAADGTVTYAPAACGVACTSRDISIRHIATRHLAKVRC